MSDITVIHGDCLEILPTLAAGSVDAIVCDPPYGLSFLGAAWDHGVPGVPFWEAALRVAKPGAHMVAFGGSRTSHRLVSAIEDAGWEIRDSLIWLYGQGMPKSLDVSKAIDKAAGAVRELGEVKVYGSGHRADKLDPGGGTMSEGWRRPWMDDPEAMARRTHESIPATDLARQWDGWGTGLKPSHEPICLARKPLIGPVARNVAEHGTGGLNVDGCRVGTSDTLAIGSGMMGYGGANGSYPGMQHPSGRWPANAILSHTSMCRSVGVKKVKGTDPIGKHGGEAGYSKGWGKQARAFDYNDADGTEVVEAWECSPGFSGEVPSYVHENAVWSPGDGPEYLLDRLASLIEAVRNYSKACNIPSLRADEFYCSEGIGSAVSSGVLADAVVCALGLRGLLDSRVGYPSCRRFCGGHVRTLLMAARDGLPSLTDALDCVHSDLKRLVHSPTNPSLVPPSSWDGFPSTDGDACTIENSISVDHGSRLASPGPRSRMRGTNGSGPPRNGRHDSTEVSRNVATDGSGTPTDNAGTSEAVRILALFCADLAWRFILPGSMIQRREIHINVDPCPVAELDAMAGERKGDSPTRKPRRHPSEGNDFWQQGGGGFRGQDGMDYETAGFTDTGGPSRYFYTPKASPSERGGVGHPTVKPLALMRWLVRLITPPGGLVLDMFCGSGSTGLACIDEGMRFIGIDVSTEYIEMARARIADYYARTPLFTEVAS